MSKRLSVIILLFLFVMTAAAYAGGEAPTPVSIPGGVVVTPAEAKALMESGKAVFFDVRNPINFGRGHVPGARPLPYTAAVVRKDDHVPPPGAVDLSRLPDDKGRGVLFYSHGETGWKSYLAARSAIEAGYRKVYWMRGGMRAWSGKGYMKARGAEGPGLQR